MRWCCHHGDGSHVLKWAGSRAECDQFITIQSWMYEWRKLTLSVGCQWCLVWRQVYFLKQKPDYFCSCSYHQAPCGGANVMMKYLVLRWNLKLQRKLNWTNRYRSLSYINWFFKNMFLNANVHVNLWVFRNWTKSH